MKQIFKIIVHCLQNKRKYFFTTSIKSNRILKKTKREKHTIRGGNININFFLTERLHLYNHGAVYQLSVSTATILQHTELVTHIYANGYYKREGALN